jgi:hypothetical protein
MPSISAYIFAVAGVAGVCSSSPFELITLAGGRPISFVVRRRPMISKSKLVAILGAIAFIAATGLTAATGLSSPARAANYSAAANGGGSAGYNHQVATDYRLKHHHAKHHVPSKPQ